MNKGANSWVIGIDEAGRGPIAGPVSVGVAMIPADFDMSWFSGIKDSKKLSPKKRAEWLHRANDMPEIILQTSMTPAYLIDEKGIVFAIRQAMDVALRAVTNQRNAEEISILLDGALSAPSSFTNQRTIIGGDASEPLIALASIAAKVTRDNHMIQMALTYPNYGFEAHKGYGTKAHYEAIKSMGVCEIHRRSFLTGLKF